MRRCGSSLPDQMEYHDVLFTTSLCVAELAGTHRPDLTHMGLQKQTFSMEHALFVSPSGFSQVSASYLRADWKLVNGEHQPAAALLSVCANLLDTVLEHLGSSASTQSAAEAAQHNRARSGDSSSSSEMFDVPLDTDAALDAALAEVAAASSSSAGASRGLAGMSGVAAAQRGSHGASTSGEVAFAMSFTSGDKALADPPALQQLLARVPSKHHDLCRAAQARLQAVLAHAVHANAESGGLQVSSLTATSFTCFTHVTVLYIRLGQHTSERSHCWASTSSDAADNLPPAWLPLAGGGQDPTCAAAHLAGHAFICKLGCAGRDVWCLCQRAARLRASCGFGLDHPTLQQDRATKGRQRSCRHGAWQR